MELEQTIQIVEVSSLVEFMARLNINQPSEHILFYRGHSDESYKLEPTAYRKSIGGKSFRSVERSQYQDLLRQSPDAFLHDKNTFERIVHMQHHGLTTRLLNLTLNPLMALYFACSNKNDITGE